MRMQASECEALAANVKTATFERRLGAALVLKLRGKKMADLIREWDKNGDGDINLIECRACVRNSLSLKADNKEIDAFFSRMDSDGGGSLDLSELQPALKKLHEAASSADAEADKLREDALSLRDRARQVDECAEATAVVEAQEKKLAELQAHPPLERRLGAQIVSRNVKIGDLITKWDKDGDGSISKAEFAANVAELVKGARRDESDALFDSYDADGGGTLDLQELKPTLKKLSDAALEQAAVLKKMQDALTAVKKTAVSQQKQIVAAQAREAAEARAKSDAETMEARAVEEAAQEKTRIVKQAAAAKAAAKASEQAAFEAKIQARRSGT